MTADQVFCGLWLGLALGILLVSLAVLGFLAEMAPAWVQFIVRRIRYR